MKRRATLAQTWHGAGMFAAFSVAGICCNGWAASAAEWREAGSVRAASAAAQTGKTISDSAVRPAGGGHCSHCPSGRCHHAPMAGHGHHHGCQNGVCVPSCPVRPHQFGFYGTRWRKWPGQDIVPVSAERAVTPAVPPRSAVPGADEESMSPQAGDMPLDPGSAAAPAGPEFPELPAEPDDAQPAPAEVMPPVPEPAPAQPNPAQPAAEPAPPAPEPLFPAEPAAPAKPEPKAEPTPPEEENLFEVRARPRVRRKIPVGESVRTASPTGDEAGSVQPTRHLSPAERLDVPPVPFDAAAETRRLRRER